MSSEDDKSEKLKLLHYLYFTSISMSIFVAINNIILLRLGTLVGRDNKT
jgi:hypothetical protein